MVTSTNRRKKSFRFLAFGLVSFLLGGLAAGAPLAAESYAAEYLAPFAVPAAINEAGSIVGWNPIYRTAFVYEDAMGYVELPCLRGHVCRALDINDGGMIAGVAESPELFARHRAVGWSKAKGRYVLFSIPINLPLRDTYAIAVDNLNRFLGYGTDDITAVSTPVSFVWTLGGKLRALPVPGPVVDINDAGLVVGNSKVPYLFDLATSELVLTTVPSGWTQAQAHAISPAGIVAGAVVDAEGLHVAAMTDKDGFWMPLGGGGDEDYLFGINAAGDVGGHVHGLERDSHCGIVFADQGVLATLESYSFPATNLWRVGEVAGITANRWLAAEGRHAVTGLPGLVRLKLAKEPATCGRRCIGVGELSVEAAISTGPLPTYLAEVELQATDIMPLGTKVELTWILDGGLRVVRTVVQAGADGRVTSQVMGAAGGAEVYVTRLAASGFAFDPTTGVLYATTGK